MKKNIKILIGLVLITLIILLSPYIIYYSSHNIAKIYTNKENYSNAEKIYSLGIKFELNEHLKLKLRNDLANLYYTMKNYPKSEKIYLENLNIRKNKYPNGIQEISDNCYYLAMIYKKTKNKEKEKKYFDELFEYRINKFAENNVYNRYEPFIELQRYYEHNKNFDKVIAILEYMSKMKKSELHPILNFQSVDFDIDLWIAKSYRKKEDIQKAELFFQKAFKLSENQINNSQSSHTISVCNEYTKEQKNCKSYNYFGFYEEYGDFELSKKQVNKAKELYKRQLALLNQYTYADAYYPVEVKRLENKISKIK